jgi:arylsulfatase A-like enzyme
MQVPANRPPNILYIMPDQWRGMDLGILADSPVRTPNLDRLAQRGVVFTSAVANSPVCTAARASLLTGQYAHSVGMAVNDLPLASDTNTIAKMLAKAGYFTGMIGKWHLEGGPRMPGYVAPGPRRQGFEFWAGSICNHDYFRQVYFRDDPSPIRMAEYETYGWTKLALEFLDIAQQRKQPWFLCMHQGPPHDPYLLPPGFEKSYDPANIPLRPNWQEGAVTANGRPTGTREQIAAYYAAIECLDQEIGRVVDRVDMSNTVVLFFSDHGDMLGSHQMALKRKPWEESCLVPMIFAGAGIASGQRTAQPISHIDIVPTLLGVAGLRKTREMPGFDFSPFLRSTSSSPPSGAPRHSMLMSHGRTEGGQFPPWRGLRTPKWKYARFEDRPWVLYDLPNDPYEQRNLSGDKDFEKLMAGFDREIAAWQRQFADDWTEQVDWLLRGR